MLAKFVEKIQGMAFNQIERDGRLLVNWAMSPIKGAEPDVLSVRTLDGILDYIVSEKMNPDDVIIHVKDHVTAYLCGKLYGPEKQRDYYICASAYKIDTKFDTNLVLNDFITYIQAGFVPDENTAAILRALSNIVDETSVEYTDNGMTQRVTALTGIVRRETITLPNPVILRPYRTFPDIEQPASPFVLRVDKVAGSIVCMLKEADGGAWKNTAVALVKNWFQGAGLERGIEGLQVVG